MLLGKQSAKARSGRGTRACLLSRDYTNVWQIAVFFGVIEAVADHKFVRNLKSDVIAFQGKLAARRFIQQGRDFAKVTAGELASRNPKTIAPNDLAAKAVERMERFSITTLVVTEGEKVLGVIHLHDLLKNGIV